MIVRIGVVLAVALVVGIAGATAQQGGRASMPGTADLDRMTQAERQDFGVPAPRQLHRGPMHGPTPSSIPGAQVVTTKGLVALVQGGGVPFVLFDVLGQPENLPGAVPAAWMAQPGSFDDPVQRQAVEMLRQRTGGRSDVALVFYCQSRECWMSYNAALRAVNAGYTNVLWYRGGIEAWKAAGLPTHSGQAGPGGPPPPAGRDGAARQAGQAGLPPQFAPVDPLTRTVGSGAPPSRPPGELRIGQGRFFSFALPPGWQIGEDGQFALSTGAPDGSALTFMVGNAGLAPNYPPDRFAYEKLAALRPQGLRLGQGRPARPAAGFRHAVEFDIAYVQRGVAYRGIGKVSIAPAYDSATMALTAALAVEDQWPGYARWLPIAAEQISATNGAAFGMRGIMQQNLQNSAAFGQAAREYREWSQKNWQGVTDERGASQDRRNFAVRENLGGVQTFANPYGSGPAVEMPMTYRHYWMDRQGRFVGTDDPSADPNMGSTGEWRRMDRVNR